MQRFACAVALVVCVGGCALLSKRNTQEIVQGSQSEEQTSASMTDETPQSVEQQDQASPTTASSLLKILYMTDIPDMETMRARERERQASHMTRTWILHSVDFATCGVEGVSTRCLDGDTIESRIGDAVVSDEDAELILAWGAYDETKDTDGNYSHEIEKSYVIPASIYDPSEAVNYLLVTLHHHGVYERPTVTDVWERLVVSLSYGRIPDMQRETLDAARRNEVYQPVFARTISNQSGDAVIPTPEFLALQQSVAACGGATVRIESKRISDSWTHLLIVEREGAIVAAASIERSSGSLFSWDVMDGHPQPHPFDRYGSGHR